MLTLPTIFDPSQLSNMLSDFAKLPDTAASSNESFVDCLFFSAFLVMATGSVENFKLGLYKHDLFNYLHPCGFVIPETR